MRYANLIAHSHIARTPDARLTADARRAVITAKAAVVVATESAKRFARTEALTAATARSTARPSCAPPSAPLRPAWK